MIVTRFAPSPTGYLHLGHIASAWRAYSHARQSSGRFLIRIEDIDKGRCRLEYEQAILEDLTWLGFKWEEPVYRQSEHLVIHHQAMDYLIEEGLIYPCFCSRKDIEAAQSAPHGVEGPIYPGTCRGRESSDIESRLSAGENPAWRLDVTKGQELAGALFFTDEYKGRLKVNPGLLGDVVLGRKDGTLSYHLCSVVDDATQGVNTVIRGEDLLVSTHIHRLLQELLGLPTPLYAHHPLLLNEKGERLSKRDQSLSIRRMREEGIPAEVIITRSQAALG